MRVAFFVIFCGAVGLGCTKGGGSDVGGGGDGDMGREIPDGHLQTGCTGPMDCDDNDPCTVEGCQAGMCTHNPMDCSGVVSGDACKMGMCVADHGTASCQTMTANEGGNCMTGTGAAGKCLMGICQMIPACTESQQVFGGTEACGAQPISDDTSDTFAGYSNVIADYGTCATGLTGPETYFPFMVSTTKMVTISLTQETGNPDLGQSNSLELVVLQGASCIASATCVTSTQMAGTPGSVTFMAQANQQYTIVVDSKGAGGPFTINFCGGSCTGSSYLYCDQPSDSKMNNDPSYSTNLITDWGTCDSMMTGPEVIYQFSPPANGSYTFALTGLTADLDLIVMAGDSSSCDPTSACVAQSTTRGTGNETVTFTADATKTYYIAVDGYSGAVSSYTIKLTSTSCPGVDCSNYNNTLGCTYLEDTRRNDDTNHSTNKVDSWQCDSGTDGPEVVYTFAPPAKGSYTVTLDGLSANLDLIVTPQSMSTFSCDAGQTCTGVGKNTGTTAESVTFMADPANTYYVAVDGVAMAAGTYHIKLSSTACPAPVCNDGSSDLDCTYYFSYTNTNDAYGATSDVSTWGKSGTANYDTGLTGPEYLHGFTAPADGTYQFEMIGLHANLDLIAIKAATPGACDPGDTVVAVSKNAGTMEESVSITAKSGDAYYLVVDGQAGAISRYTIAVTGGCP